MRLALVLAIAATGCRSLLGIDDPVVTDASTCAMQSVATGNGFSCAVDPHGSVWCWGANDAGETQPASPGGWTLTPARVDLPQPAVQVSAGTAFACARLVDGTVWCWGYNGLGELGLGTTDPQAAAVQAAIGEAAIDLDAGSWHACVRRASDSAIMCWGASRHNDLGMTMPDWNVLPPTLIASTVGARVVALGHSLGCTIDASNALSCWGQNKFGQLADATMSNSPSLLPIANIGPVLSVAAAGRATCALLQSGDVTCWGDGAYGELGRGDFTSSTAAGTTATTGAIAVRVANYGACALHADGTVACWGGIDNGDGTLAVQATARPAMVSGATALAAKWYHACAIANGQVVCWGDNSDGALGRGKRSVHTVPGAVSLPGAASAVSVGSQACAAVGTRLFCWGSGPLGDGTRDGAASPVEITTGLATIDGLARGCAWGSGVGRCWGYNSSGQLGTAVVTPAELTPVTVQLSGITQMATGMSFGCAIAGGRVYCWGKNTVGQLGNGTTSNTPDPTPTAVSSTGTNIVKVVAGVNHACALDSLGAVKCWGVNNAGELGDGTTTNSATPVSPAFTGTPPKIVDIVSIHEQIWVLTDIGEVYGWGRNTSGELGIGNLTNWNMPTKLNLPSNAIAIADSCAKMMSGDWYCWGNDTYGQLADGATTTQTSPIGISTLAGATQVSRGDASGCALGSGGQVSCWGIEPMLGDGDLSNEMPMPVDLPCN